MYLYGVFGAVIMLVAVVSFSRTGHIANRDSQGSAVICFGDSLTSGYEAAPKESYPHVLSGLLDWPVINAGVNGDTTQAALQRLSRDVLEKDPLLVVVILGGNDFLHKSSAAQTFENIRAIVRAIKQQGAMVALGQIGPLLMYRYNKEYKKIAAEEDAILIPDILGGIFANPKLMRDEVHPNAAGNVLIAQKVHKAIEKHLRLNQKLRREL